MSDEAKPMPSMRDLAEALGISVATISRALRDDPSVQEATRIRVKKEAEARGYRRNALVGNFMASIRNSTASHFRGNLALLWGKQPNLADKRLSQIKAGVQRRAAELGYSIDDFDLATSRPESLERILFARGISGVVVAVPSFARGKVYLRLNFSKFCAVSVGWGLFRPLLDTVRFDYFQAVRLALHSAHRNFGGRIAAVWDEKTDLRSHRAAQASFVIHHPDGPGKAHKLFVSRDGLTPTLLRRHRIECLLVAAGISLPAWIHEEIPPEKIVWVEHPGERKCFGWVDTQNSLLGQWGIELLAGKISRHESGVPESCKVVLVPPKWRKASDK